MQFQGVTQAIWSKIEDSIMRHRSQGDIVSHPIRLTWRYGERRIEDRRRDHVFTIHNITIAAELTGQGIFTSIMQRLATQPQLARRIDWIYLEQVNFRLANHLQDKLGFKADNGMVIDCWRMVDSQMELGL